jgi:hypothetical protein
LFPNPEHVPAVNLPVECSLNRTEEAFNRGAVLDLPFEGFDPGVFDGVRVRLSDTSSPNLMCPSGAEVGRRRGITCGTKAGGEPAVDMLSFWTLISLGVVAFKTTDRGKTTKHVGQHVARNAHRRSTV